MAIPPPSFLVLRHGQTTWNAEGRWQGWADAPLSDLGEQQARSAAAHLGAYGFTAFASSDLQRARRTAELLAEGLGSAADVVVEAGLRERNVGAFAGKTITELLVAYPECFEPDTRRLLQVPEGETDEDLWRRTAPALVALAERFAGERLLVVSHGGVIRTIERHLGIDPGASTPNLGGRWLSVVDGHLVGGDRHLPVEPELVSAPKSE